MKDALASFFERIKSLFSGEEEVPTIDDVEYAPALPIDEQGGWFIYVFAIPFYIFIIMMTNIDAIAFFRQFPEKTRMIILLVIWTAFYATLIMAYFAVKDRVRSRYEGVDILFTLSKIGQNIVKEEFVVVERYLVSKPEPLIVGEEHIMSLEEGSFLEDNRRRRRSNRSGRRPMRNGGTPTPPRPLVETLSKPEFQDFEILTDVAPMELGDKYIYLIRDERGAWRYLIMPFPWEDMMFLKLEFARSEFFFKVRGSIVWLVHIGYAYSGKAERPIPVFALKYSVNHLVTSTQWEIDETDVELKELLKYTKALDVYQAQKYQVQLKEVKKMYLALKEELESMQVKIRELAEDIASEVIRTWIMGASALARELLSRRERIMMEWGPIIIAALAALLFVSWMFFLTGGL